MKPALGGLVGAVLVMAAGACAAMDYGRFQGTVRVEWLRENESERRMRLLEPFAYFDPSGKRWEAPVGYVTDGASIPQGFWSLVGGPFEGAYREAAVIHDVYCDTKAEPWRDVHRIFYYANRAAGVSEVKSKILYTAVMVGGPRWAGGESKCHGCHMLDETYSTDRNGVLVKRPVVADDKAKAATEWVSQTNPTLEQIDEYIRDNFPETKLEPHGVE